VVHHRHLEAIFGPVQGVGVGALAGQEQGLEIGQVVLFHQFGIGVLALDGPKGRGRGEHGLDLVVGDHPPEHAGIRCAHRFALEQDGGAALEQRAVDDVAVAHHPAHIRGRPVDVAGIHVVDVLHGPFQGHHMAAVVADHALGLAVVPEV
jgi:hypothetical protein